MGSAAHVPARGLFRVPKPEEIGVKILPVVCNEPDVNMARFTATIIGAWGHPFRHTE